VLSSPKPIGGQLYFKTVRPTASSVGKCYANPDSTDYIVNPLSGLPSSGLLDIVIPTVDGAPKKIYVIGSGSPDQKSAVVFEAHGKEGWISIIGKDGQKSTKHFRIPTRRQWREIPGMRTDQ
jgi:hypothetical protein